MTDHGCRDSPALASCCEVELAILNTLGWKKGLLISKLGAGLSEPLFSQTRGGWAPVSSTGWGHRYSGPGTGVGRHLGSPKLELGYLGLYPIRDDDFPMVLRMISVEKVFPLKLLSPIEQILLLGPLFSSNDGGFNETFGGTGVCDRGERGNIGIDLDPWQPRLKVEVYQSDFNAEREARARLVGEKDQLAEDLRHLQRRNQQLIDDLSKYQQTPNRQPPTSTTAKGSKTELVWACNEDGKREDAIKNVGDEVCQKKTAREAKKEMGGADNKVFKFEEKNGRTRGGRIVGGYRKMEAFY
uniref:NF-kappa-B essential modulator NEMO CC2-LZ domain-containing protein n=1 Tax=Timema poppense TaxID=170557 RepID=A0A7R9CHG5_TIMPO|nr:unnamed protein product [Timema poppensis]